MDRRTFLKGAASAGLMLIPALSGTSRSRANSALSDTGYDGPLFVMVNAMGGWDPTLLCDPKGRNGDDDPGPVNRTYDQSEILTRGNLSFAPVGANEMFFDKYYESLLVINGIDMQTNGHDNGLNHMWSGSLSGSFPSFAAMVAGTFGPSLPVSYITFGGYDNTDSLVARSRFGDAAVLGNIVRPETGRFGSRYHSELADEAIARARAERDADQLRATRLPHRRRAMDMFFSARSGVSVLEQLEEYLPEPLDVSDNPLIHQAQVAIAAYRANICVAVNMNIRGFDTHGNHDDTHIPRLERLLLGVDFLMEEAARQGVADKVVVVMGSDLGRRPWYNQENGKDHWSISSMMLMGSGIIGNRVVGLTDGEIRPALLNPDTLMPDEQGVRITPSDIHAALRSLAGIDEEMSAKYPLASGSNLSGLLG